MISAVFVIFFIWENRKVAHKERKSLPIWKSDVAPALQSLHAGLNQALGDTERSKRIRNLSEANVRLVRYEDGWKLADARSASEKAHDGREEG